MKRTLLTLLAALALIAASAQSSRQYGRESRALEKLRMAESMIETFYVDDVNADTIVEEAIRAMLSALDPHSQYSTAEETRALDEPLQGNFSGIGITFNQVSDTVVIIQPTASGPSERVGILPGDRIIMVNDTVVSGVKMPKNDIMRRIRGPKGEPVKISVERRGAPELVDFIIIRDDIPIYSVEAAYMVDNENGYIRLSRFAEDTPAEMEEAIAKLKKQGMKNLILDLQDNGGGYLVAATELAEMFLNRGDKVVFTKGSSTPARYYLAERSGDIDSRLVVLVNQYSASASEILSGAMQDNDRALIVGRRTFGKGLVQRPFRFDDGSMMRLTIARYYTPSGRCIQKPYTLGDEDAYRDDISDRFNSGELMSADSIRFDKNQLYHTRAGRPVYGGGGIMPDRFVPLDTTAFTQYYRNLLAKSALIKYTLTYLDENRAWLAGKYKKQDDFIKKFTVDPAMMKALTELGEAEGVPFDQEQYALSEEYLKTVVKALLARDLYDETAYFRIMNPSNPIFVQGYELIKDPVEYHRLLKKQ